MKKILIGTAIGLAAGVVIYKLYQQGKLDGVCNDMNKFTGKTKKNFKNLVDVSKNQAEYVKERLEYGFENGKEKLSELGK